jgi:hypothetical protein
MTPLATSAEFYAALGIAVFRLGPRDKKPPKGSRGFKDASVDIEVVRRWWRLRPDANIGVATGPNAGFWVLDLDGPAAEAALQALVDIHGPLPATVEQATGNGRHLCFRWDARFPIRNSASKIGPHIDVRGDGGYIVAPPSIHPSGRIYAWTEGRSPGALAFANAPDWLCRLAMPAEAPAPAAVSRGPRQHEDGRASRFGEAVLSTACRMIATAPAGKQQENLWGYACQVGGFVAGGEIESDYARRALIDAGERMAPAGKPWSRKEIESHVDRGIAKGGIHPRTAPELRGHQSAGPRTTTASARPSAAAAAIDVRDARALWGAARPADCALVRSWFRARGLEAAALPEALANLRAHARAPMITGGVGPALLAPLVVDPDAKLWGDVDALAVIPLVFDRWQAPVLLGESEGRVALLTSWPADGALLVGVDLEDVWALGANAHENGHELGLVLAPRLKTFAGGFLGDKWGRADPAVPHADPEQPPWTASGERPVFLAVRGDLRTPELKSRKTFGGTDRQRLEGDAAARFYAGLAEQAWRRAGANQVRILRPTHGAGFNSTGRGA